MLLVIGALAAPTVALAAMIVQQRRWHRQDAVALEARFGTVDTKLEGLSKDIEGNTAIVLRVEKGQQDHEKQCRNRWERNWDEHRDLNTRVAKLEGAKE